MTEDAVEKIGASLADGIRSFLRQRYVQPAKANGNSEILIRAGDVHRDIGLANRMPAVCSVLDGRLFQEQNALELIERTGSNQGANATFRFRVLSPSTKDQAVCELHDPSRFTAALAYAALIHGNQKRKGTNIPYISHLMSVSALVMEDGGDQDQAIAGLLHDSLEDCGHWHESVIRTAWGSRVADIVLACTDGVQDSSGRKPPWRERKERYLAHLETVDADALRVSACDKLHNARTIAGDLAAGHDVFTRFKPGREGTLWYYNELLRVFRARLGETNLLVRELANAVASMTQPKMGVGA